MSELTEEQLTGMDMWDRDVMFDERHRAVGAMLVRAAVAEIRQHRARIAAHAAAHPERLSEDDVAYAAHADTPHEMVFKHHKAMGYEIQQRRAADLTPEEVAAVRDLLLSLDGEPRAMRSALTKILSDHGATP